MKYKSILFDLDGTLTDSGLGITKGVQYALQKFDIKVNDLQLLQKFIGPPLTDSFVEYYNFSKENSALALKYYREYYSKSGIFENELYMGINDLLDKLLLIKCDLYIATSKPTTYAKKVCDYFDITKYFLDIQGSDLNGDLSNKSEIIEKVIYNNNLDKIKTIMVGDREHDVIGAKNNNIDCIGVGYGYGSKDELIENGALCYVKNTIELFDILSKIEDA